MTVTPQTNTTLAEIAQVIRSHDKFVLCGHMSPDGDCLGSQLTLWHALKAMGKRATCVLVRDEPVGSSLSFLPGMDEMVPASTFDGVCEVFIGLDVPTRARIGEAACAILDSAADSITVDHHASETTMCNHVYVDPDCAAASMLVWELVKLLVDEPPLESASCAYVGLMTDTGGFRFQNADSAAFDLAARLVANGVDPAWAATNVFQTRTIPSLKLEGIAIDHMRVIANGKVSLSWVDSDDMKRVGASKTDVEPLIDSVRAVEGTMVACLIREQDGRIRGNLRAKDDTDVSALARELGGGGHRAAAGFTLDMPIGEAIELMERKLTALFE